MAKFMGKLAVALLAFLLAAFFGLEISLVSSAFGDGSSWPLFWFLTPALAVVYSFIYAANQVTNELTELGAAGAAIGTFIGGATFVVIAFVVGVPAGLASAVISYFSYRSERDARTNFGND